MTTTPGSSETASEILARYLVAASEREELLAQLRKQPVDTDAFNELNATIDLVTLERERAFRGMAAAYDDLPIVRAGLLAAMLLENVADTFQNDPDVSTALSALVVEAPEAAADDALVDKIYELAQRSDAGRKYLARDGQHPGGSRF